MDAVNGLRAGFLAVPNCAEVGRGISMEVVTLDGQRSPLPMQELDAAQGECGAGQSAGWVMKSIKTG